MKYFGNYRVPLVRRRSRIELEVIASDFLEELNGNHFLPPPRALDVIALLDVILPRVRNFYPDVTELPQGVAAETDFETREIRVTEETYEGAIRRNGHDRFTIVHEIGHVLTVTEQMATHIRLPGRQRVAARRVIRPDQDPEWQADGVAAALLMPKSHVVRLCPDWRPNREAAEILGVSWSALETRIAIIKDIEERMK